MVTLYINVAGIEGISGDTTYMVYRSVLRIQTTFIWIRILVQQFEKGIRELLENLKFPPPPNNCHTFE